VAETLDLLSGEQKLTPIWPNAYMEGRIAGAAMAGRPVPYSGGIPMNTAHFFGFPVMSAGITEMGEGCTELVQSNEKTGFYRRIILKNNVPIGMVMAGDAVDRGGIILGLIRKRTDASSFLKELADPDFNIAKMPVDMRKTKQLGKEQI
jgi:NAD(P)H-nitrite reductase large subunit